MQMLERSARIGNIRTRGKIGMLMADGLISIIPQAKVPSGTGCHAFGDYYTMSLNYVVGYMTFGSLANSGLQKPFLAGGNLHQERKAFVCAKLCHLDVSLTHTFAFWPCDGQCSPGQAIGGVENR
jgi:hypothetical protein